MTEPVPQPRDLAAHRALVDRMAERVADRCAAQCAVIDDIELVRTIIAAALEAELVALAMAHDDPVARAALLGRDFPT